MGFFKIKSRVELGDPVVDIVTGFKGVAISEHNYLHGCRRISVQPKIDKDGKVPKPHTFDEPQLKVDNDEESFRDTATSNTGGPSKYEDEGR